MSATPADIASRAREAAITVAWRQWAALGAPVSGGAVQARAIVDPEALVLVSCVLRDGERRLDDVLAWWATAGAPLMSVQRITTLRKQFPASAQGGLTAFARAVVDAGDPRWRSLAAQAEGEDELLGRGKRGGDVSLISAPALMLRLRSAFGVGVKADLLAVLLGLGGASATVRTLAAATGYTLAAVRRAAQEMTAARIAHRTLSRPVTYAADPRDWEVLLGFRPGTDAPAWRYFAQLFAFVAAVIEWSDEASSVSPYIAASTARDVFDAHRGTFELNRIRIPEPSDYRGEEYLEGFAAAVDALASWLDEAG